MFRELKTSASHEELFAERYERLLSWSLQLSENDRELAEDLLHDAFVQFTLAQPNLNQIRDLDNYFYGMLRNLHLLQVRRETRNRLQQLSVVEYDSAEDGLRTIDLRDRLHVQDQLRGVCQYTCARKETSKSASVLILRFFHGYYPSEIAQILRTSRATVDVHLLTARNEAKALLDNPAALSPIGERPKVEVLPSVLARTTDDFLMELRETIFRSRRNDCFSSARLSVIYRTGSAQIETGQLAHIVSCPSCLEEVNKMLKLPPLRKRLATDSLGRNKRRKGRGGDPPSGGSAGGAMSSLRRHARRVFEHKPQELCVSVNGYVQGSQRINAELSELSLNVNLSEDIGCVEVFSEQQVRLLLLSVDDLPPAGPVERSSRIELSDGRTLDLTLKFRNPLPALQVVYEDPTFKEVEALLANPREFDLVVEPRERDLAASSLLPSSSPDKRAPTSFRHRCLLFISRLTGGRWGTGRFLIKTSAVTALIAVIAIAAILLTRHQPGPPSTVSAAEVLHKSALAEEAIAARTDQVIHRTIKFEARKVAQTSVCDGCTGELIARRKIEVWQSAERGITARRLYDEKNQLVAGDWRRSDGVQTLYHHGKPPQIEILNPQSAISNREVWQLDPSAKAFSSLIANARPASVEERGNVYVISAVDISASSANTSAPSAVNSYLAKAVLVLNRADLHAIEQTLLVRQGDETREYKFTETSLEQRSPGSVAPTVFDPDAELLPPSAKSEGEKRELTTPVPHPPTPVTASTDLEVEVLRLLHQAGADLDEQTTVTRTPDGRLRITGLVESNERKSEILRTLAPVASNPALNIEIKTVAEAVIAAQKQRPASSSSPTVSIQSVEANANTFPAYAELRNRFSDEEARAFATRMVGRTREAMRHAWALKRLMSQFSAEELRTLAPEARAKWLSLIRDHARAFERETASLRQELQPIFSPGSGGYGSGSEMSIAGDADIDRAVERLFELGSANDQVIRSAFTISSGGSANTAVRTAQFWRALGEAQSLAARLSRQ